MMLKNNNNSNDRNDDEGEENGKVEEDNCDYNEMMIKSLITREKI